MIESESIISIESEIYVLLPNSLEPDTHITYEIEDFSFNDRLNFQFVYVGTPGQVLEFVSEFHGYWMADQELVLGVRADTKVSNEEWREGTPEFKKVKVLGATTLRHEDGTTGAVVEVYHA